MSGTSNTISTLVVQKQDQLSARHYKFLIYTSKNSIDAEYQKKHQYKPKMLCNMIFICCNLKKNIMNAIYLMKYCVIIAERPRILVRTIKIRYTIIDIVIYGTIRSLNLFFKKRTALVYIYLCSIQTKFLIQQRILAYGTNK